MTVKDLEGRLSDALDRHSIGNRKAAG